MRPVGRRDTCAARCRQYANLLHRRRQRSEFRRRDDRHRQRGDEPQRHPSRLEDNLKMLDAIGDPDTEPHYPLGWAWAGNCPFQWVKQVASHLGGTRNPMVVSWPARIKDAGGLRDQFTHLIDIVPTILDVAKLPAPRTVEGIEQKPMDGVSIASTFDDAKARPVRQRQYFEIFTNRAIYDN